MADKFDMEIEIIDVYERDGQLRVECEHAYGKDNLGLSLNEKKLDPYSDKPRWMKSVRHLLIKKYDPANRVKIPIKTDFIGKSVSLSEMEVGVASGSLKRLTINVGLTKVEAEQVIKKFPKLCEIRENIMADISLGLSKSVNEKLEKYYGGTGLGFNSDDRPEIIELKANGLIDKKGRPTEAMSDNQAGRKKAEAKK